MPIELPDNLIFAKPFSAFSLIKADGATEENGVRWLRGPIAPEDEGEDYDKQVLTKAGVDTGLEMFLRLGGGKTGHVDWGHMYRASGKNPKYLIAKGHPYQGPSGRMWLADELFKKPFADEAWEHVHAGGHAGHSMDGLCKGTDPQDERKIIKTEIHLITIDPQPKGFGNFLEIGPPQSLTQVAKGIMADIGRESLADAGWVPMPIHLDPDLYHVYFADADYAEAMMKSICHVKRLYGIGTLLKANQPDMSMPYGACPKCSGEMGEDGTCPTCTGASQKALTTGSDVVTDGATGGQTLRRQSLASKVTCECGAVNDSRRKVCRKCGKRLTMRKAMSGQVRCQSCSKQNDSRRPKCRGCGAILD